MGDSTGFLSQPPAPVVRPPSTGGEGEPALVFVLTAGLYGAASEALNRLVTDAPDLRFDDLVADALGERELDWKAQPKAYEVVRAHCLAKQSGFSGSPTVDPPPKDLPGLRAWAAQHKLAPMLKEPAGRALKRWLPDAAQQTLDKVQLAELLTDEQADPAAQLLARNYLWSHALVFARAVAVFSRFSELQGLKARQPSPPPARPAPVAWSASHPGQQRAEAVAAVLEQAMERYRRRNPRIPHLPRKEVRVELDPAAGEVRIDWQNSWYSQWTYVSLEEGHEGESHCDCMAGSNGDCVHAFWSWQRLAESLLHPQRGGLSREILDFLATPAWRRRLLSLDQALLGAHAATATAPAELLSWRLYTSGIRPTLEPVIHQPLRSGDWSIGRRSTSLDVARAHDFPNREEVLALLESQQFGPYPCSNLFRALELLAGFPRLHLDGAPQQPLAVRRGRLDLDLRELGGGRLQLRPRVDGDEELGHRLVAAARQGPRRILTLPEPPTCVLVELNGAQQALLGALGKGWDLPPEGVEALVPRLSELERHAPLSLPAAFEGETVPADPRLRLRLAAGEGLVLRAELRARPLPTGDHLVPGAGEPTAAAYCEGRRRRASRDLEAERARALALAAELGLAAGGAQAGFGWELTGEAALELLSRLHEREGGEPVVEWLEERRIETLRAPHSRQLKVRVEEKRDWFGLSGEIELDGARLSLAALLAAVQAGRRWVEVAPGRWAQIAGELRERLARAAEVVYPGRAGLELSPAAAEAVEDLFGAAGELELCAGWRATTERMKRARAFEPKLPQGLRAELRGYQVEGFQWLARLAEWGVGACLADDMGLGKTLQALALLLERSGRGPALVVAPTSVCFNWVREAERFCPGLKPILFREGDRSATLAGLGPGDLLICSYGLLVRHTEELRGRRFASLVLDEAQAVKNPATRRARAARDLDAEWKLALTGTPMENHLGELWSLFQIVTPGLLGSWGQFRERFAGPIERTRDPERRAALARVVRPFILRRTKAEVARDLPSRTELKREVSLSSAERSLYDDARLAALTRLSGQNEGAGDQRFEVLAALTRLRQLACHPRLLDPGSKLPSAKLSELMGLVEELRENGHRALVFSQFTSHLALVREALEARGVSYLYLDGQTPEAERARQVDRFQGGESELFLISLKAGGTGLNLTGADFVIHLDPWWNPAVEDQATDRAHRIGQTRPVTVYRLVAKGTIEESILALHDEKRDLVAGVLDGAAGTGRLTTEELLQLIRSGGDSGAEVEAEDLGDEVVEVLQEPAAVAPAAPAAESMAELSERFEEALRGEISPATFVTYGSTLRKTLRWFEWHRGRACTLIAAEELEELLGAFERAHEAAGKGPLHTVINRLRKFAAR